MEGRANRYSRGHFRPVANLVNIHVNIYVNRKCYDAWRATHRHCRIFKNIHFPIFAATLPNRYFRIHFHHAANLANIHVNINVDRNVPSYCGKRSDILDYSKMYNPYISAPFPNQYSRSHVHPVANLVNSHVKINVNRKCSVVRWAAQRHFRLFRNVHFPI